MSDSHSQSHLIEVKAIPSDKIMCYISAKLRKKTNEEQIRQIASRSIVEEYSYEKKDIEIEYTIKMGRAKKGPTLLFLTRERNILRIISILL